jgi:hypothetical protein
MMHKLALGGLALALAFAAAPATAVTYMAGTSKIFTFDGVDGDGNPAPGATASLTLTLDSLVGAIATFSYALSNTSDGMLQPEIRITGFGFDTDPEADDGAVIAGFANISVPGMFPQLGGRSVCVHTGPTCQGGGGGGVELGDTLLGSFTLDFGGALSSFDVSNLAVRYQSLGDDGQDSGVGTGTLVPEPASWAMLIAGFGLVGAAMRRRKGDIATITA